MNVTRPVLRYHGGKWKLAEWIISKFPHHKTYVEPFGGGGSVLMQKPRSKIEVYNDLDIISCTRSRYPLMLELPKRPHVPAEQILDLQSSGWSSIRTKCPNTRARVRAGRKAFGDRFVMPYYGSGSGLTGRSLARPLGTITTKDRWALVVGNRMRMLSVEEYRRGMGFPEDYALPSKSTDAKKMLGNAVCPPVACDYLQKWMEAL